NRLSWIDLINEDGVSVQEIENQKNEELEGKSQLQPDISTKNDFFIQQDSEDKITEGDFILRLDYLARKRKLRYSPEDLYNFHTSLKTSNFTILGGMSGTGKTQLAMLYAEALKIKEGDNLLFIPAKPSYT